MRRRMKLSASNPGERFNALCAIPGAVARLYLARLRYEPRFSAAFQPCIAALARHLETAAEKIARLG